jgi:hypothetical protein
MRGIPNTQRVRSLHETIQAGGIRDGGMSFVKAKEPQSSPPSVLFYFVSFA